MKSHRIAVFLLFLGTALLLGGCSLPGGRSAGAGDAASDESGSVSSYEDTGEIIIPVDSAPVVSEALGKDNVSHFVELGNYKDMKIEAGDDTPIENGMTATIRYVGTIDGEDFAGGSSDSYDLLIGSGSFVDNFEEQLLSHKVGDRVTVTVTFPKSYGSSEVAGREASFDVTIKKVYYTTPDIAYAQFVDSCTVKQYPEDLVKAWTDMYIDSYGAYVTTSGEATREDILSLFGMSEETFDSMILSYVKEELVDEAVMQEEGVTREDKAYQSALLETLSSMGFTSEEEAEAAGTPAFQIRYAGDNHFVQSVLVKYEAK